MKRGKSKKKKNVLKKLKKFIKKYGGIMNKVKFKGSQLTLIGISPNQVSSNFRVIAQDMSEVKLSNFDGKIKVITSFPSLDTPVCDLQLKEFNKIATSLEENIVILGISCDLPFAQKRFCEMNEIKNVYVLSDYKYHSFGINFCVLIKELNLLARTVFILDRENNIRYTEIVEEITRQPDYEKAIENINKVIEKNEKKWEEIKCCKWEQRQDDFVLKFSFKTDEEIGSFLKIVSLIKVEKNINFDLKISNKSAEISIAKNEFNIEIGSIFERIVY
jgi:thiol peroxidase